MTLSTTHCALRVEEKFAYQVASGDLPIYTNSRLSKQRNCRERLATDAGSIQTALYIAAPPAKGTESKNKKRRGTNARRTKSASYLGRSFELIKTKSLLSTLKQREVQVVSLCTRAAMRNNSRSPSLVACNGQSLRRRAKGTL